MDQRGGCDRRRERVDATMDGAFIEVRLEPQVGSVFQGFETFEIPADMMAARTYFSELAINPSCVSMLSWS